MKRGRKRRYERRKGETDEENIGGDKGMVRGRGWRVR